MLPVAELHLHIEGTLEPELLVRLAARNDVALPTTDVAELRARYQFDSLQSLLHLHFEGTLEPELLVRLAARNDVALPTTDVAELRARYQFDSLQSFLDLHYANLRVLQRQQDFYDLARAYLTRAAAAGVRRAEIFFDPQTHLGHGVPLAAVFGGLTAAAGRGPPAPRRPPPTLPCFLR